jgi:hypothetical protein
MALAKLAPEIRSGKCDVLPSKGRNMRDDVIGNRRALLGQSPYPLLKVDGVPQANSRDH